MEISDIIRTKAKLDRIVQRRRNAENENHELSYFSSQFSPSGKPEEELDLEDGLKNQIIYGVKNLRDDVLVEALRSEGEKFPTLLRALFDALYPEKAQEDLKRVVFLFVETMKVIAQGKDLQARGNDIATILLSRIANIPEKMHAFLCESGLELVLGQNDSAMKRVNLAVLWEVVCKLIESCAKKVNRGNLDPEQKCKGDYSLLSGDEFRSLCIKQICFARWSMTGLIPIMSSLVDILNSNSVSPDDVDLVSGKIKGILEGETTLLSSSLSSVSGGVVVSPKIKKSALETGHALLIKLKITEVDDFFQLLLTLSARLDCVGEILELLIDALDTFFVTTTTASSLSSGTSNFYQVFSILLSRFNVAASQNAKFGTCLLKRENLMSCAGICFLLALGRGKRFEGKVLEYLVGKIVSQCKFNVRCTFSGWMHSVQTQSDLSRFGGGGGEDHDHSSGVVAFLQTQKEVLSCLENAKIGGWDLLIPILISMSIRLIDLNNSYPLLEDSLWGKSEGGNNNKTGEIFFVEITHTMNNTTVTSTLNEYANREASLLGVELIRKCYEYFPFARNEILELIITRGLTCGPPACVGSPRFCFTLLSRLTSAMQTRKELLSQSSMLKDIIGNLPNMVPRTAVSILDSLRVLLVGRRDLCDHAAIVFRKGLFQRETNPKLVSVYGLLMIAASIVRFYGDKQNLGELGLSQGVSSSSQGGNGEMHYAVNTVETESAFNQLLLDEVGCLRRVLTQAKVVRAGLYVGIRLLDHCLLGEIVLASHLKQNYIVYEEEEEEEEEEEKQQQQQEEEEESGENAPMFNINNNNYNKSKLISVENVNPLNFTACIDSTTGDIVEPLPLLLAAYFQHLSTNVEFLRLSLEEKKQDENYALFLALVQRLGGAQFATFGLDKTSSFDCATVQGQTCFSTACLIVSTYEVLINILVEQNVALRGDAAQAELVNENLKCIVKLMRFFRGVIKLVKKYFEDARADELVLKKTKKIDKERENKKKEQEGMEGLIEPEKKKESSKKKKTSSDATTTSSSTSSSSSNKLPPAGMHFSFKTVQYLVEMALLLPWRSVSDIVVTKTASSNNSNNHRTEFESMCTSLPFLDFLMDCVEVKLSETGDNHADVMGLFSNLAGESRAQEMLSFQRSIMPKLFQFFLRFASMDRVWAATNENEKQPPPPQEAGEVVKKENEPNAGSGGNTNNKRRKTITNGNDEEKSGKSTKQPAVEQQQPIVRETTKTLSRAMVASIELFHKCLFNLCSAEEALLVGVLKRLLTVDGGLQPPTSSTSFELQNQPAPQVFHSAAVAFHSHCEDALDSPSRLACAQPMFEIVKCLVGKIPSRVATRGLLGKHVKWLQTICAKSEVKNIALIRLIVSVYLECSLRSGLGENPTLFAALEGGMVLSGGVLSELRKKNEGGDEAEGAGSNSDAMLADLRKDLKIARKHSCVVITMQLVQHLNRILEECEMVFSHPSLSMQIREESVLIRLLAVCPICVDLLKCDFTNAKATVESLLRCCSRFYKLLSKVLRNCIVKKVLYNLNDLKRLANELGKRMSPSLLQVVYELELAVQNKTKEKKNNNSSAAATTSSGGNDAKLLPEVIFQVEQYEINLLKLSQTIVGGLVLSKYVKRNAGRDIKFDKILVTKMMEEMTKEEEEEEEEGED